MIAININEAIINNEREKSALSDPRKVKVAGRRELKTNRLTSNYNRVSYAQGKIIVT